MIQTLKTKLHGEDLFDSLKPEEEKPDKKFEIKSNSPLERMVNGFERVVKRLLYPVKISNSYEKEYKCSILSIPKTYASKDITDFYLFIPQINDKYPDTKTYLM